MPQLRRQARLARIAGALASGATVTEIAEDEGISRALASRETNSPECLQLIAEFVDAEHELMVGLCYRAVRVIEEAFEARREYTTRAGEVVPGGPDHYARLTATKHLRDFLTAGRPPAKHGDKRSKMMTWEEIVRRATPE